MLPTNGIDPSTGGDPQDKGLPLTLVIVARGIRGVP